MAGAAPISLWFRRQGRAEKVKVSGCGLHCGYPYHFVVGKTNAVRPCRDAQRWNHGTRGRTFRGTRGVQGTNGQTLLWIGPPPRTPNHASSKVSVKSVGGFSQFVTHAVQVPDMFRGSSNLKVSG